MKQFAWAFSIPRSLYTSLVPPLALVGIGSAIAMSTNLKKKVFLLNATFDRESENLTALDFVNLKVS